MDNISIKKIWEDNDFFEVEFIAHSKYVNAKVNLYLSSKIIIQIQSNITDFLYHKKKCSIELGGSSNENYITALKMEMLIKPTGHIVIDTKIILDDDASPQHECNFYIKTEYGILEKFSDNLSMLSNGEIGTRVMLLS